MDEEKLKATQEGENEKLKEDSKGIIENFKEKKEEIETENEEVKKDELDESSKTLEEKNINNNNKKIWITLGILACVAVLALIGMNRVVLKYESVVYPGVSIYNEDLSKLTKEQLDKKLYQLENTIKNKTINIEANKKYYTVKIKDITLGCNIKDISNEIINHKKDKNMFGKFIAIVNNSKKSFEFNININKEKLNDLEEKIAKETNIKVKESQVIINGSNISCIKGENGFELQNNFIVKDIDSKLQGIKNLNSNINISLKYKKEVPKVAMEDLKKIDSKISTYTTTYESGCGRSRNVENAANKIDNVFLMPGEEFSYEKHVGPVVLSNGYTYAPVISDGELKQGVGGGVCQVSSTLYNTTLKAGILPTQRRNHSKPVHYVPRGLDATLASGSIDYKFKNTYEYPIVINTKSGGGVLTVEFWSNEKAMNGIEYKPVSYARGNYANTYLYGYDKEGNKVYEKHIDTSIYR
ncbi:VanW family protein [Romboutsia sp.]|uniref:VanW family protein n=1 Tax=Romboutsia sp. TaxID=1965302 RepID=UPI003F316F88